MFIIMADYTLVPMYSMQAYTVNLDCICVYINALSDCIHDTYGYITHQVLYTNAITHTTIFAHRSFMIVSCDDNVW